MVLKVVGIPRPEGLLGQVLPQLFMDPDKWATTNQQQPTVWGAVGGSAVGGRAVKPPTCIGARVNGRSAPESHGISQPVVGDDGLKNEMKS